MMNNNGKWLATGILLGTTVLSYGQAGGVPRANNTTPTDAYEKSQVQAWLKVDVDKETDTVHFVRDNNDPYVITKTYVLKHADPYEMRPYIREAVQAKRIDGDNTTVECLKFNDGTAIIVVSAEEFRFKGHENGMSLDEVVAKLDQPKMSSSSGQLTYFYFPSYSNAGQLADMVGKVGANMKNEAYELQSGKDKVYYDPHLNCVFFYTPQYSRKNIEYMIRQYDIPRPEITLKYAVYEVNAENDGKLGLDFQAWKNNGGADLLSLGGRYRSNWTSTMAGNVSPEGSSKTQLFNLNPKWNSKYLDFLAAKGHAKVVTSGDLVVRNNKTGYIERKTNIFNIDSSEKIQSETFGPEYIALNQKKFVLYTSSASSSAKGCYAFKAYDTGGTPILLTGGGISTTDAVTATMTVTKSTDSSNITRYYLKLDDTSLSFTKNGANYGAEVEAGGFALYKGVENKGDTALTSTDDWSQFKSYSWSEQKSWNSGVGMTIDKGNKIFVKASPAAYGFKITVSPSVCTENTILNITMHNDSLIGWQSTGAPRIAKGSAVDSKVMISNKSNRFVIGGLEKKEVVRSVTGIPFLKDIPILGWAFSTEVESTKRSQLILVAQCEVSRPETGITDGIQGDILNLNKALKKAGDSNQWGFQQMMLDKSK